MVKQIILEISSSEYFRRFIQYFLYIEVYKSIRDTRRQQNSNKNKSTWTIKQKDELIQ